MYHKFVLKITKMLKGTYILVALFLYQYGLMAHAKEETLNITAYSTDSDLLNTTELATMEITDDLDEKSCPVECTCTYYTGVEVKCYGEDIKSIGDLNLPDDTKSLRLIETGISSLYARDFTSSLRSLESILIDNSKNLEYIESGTFDDLLSLNYIKINEANKLSQFEPGVFGNLPSLRKLYINHCGLTSVPNITNLVAHEIYFRKLQLTYNRIDTIKPYMFQGIHNVYEVDLSHNQLATLPRHAFYGSNLTVLNLGYNPITDLDEDVFVGIRGLREIILRNTLITFLPTNGLKYIETLDLQETSTLIKFPPVFKFERIETAKLYYFSHCCAFSYLVEESADFEKLHKVGSNMRTTDCPVTGTSSEESVLNPSPSVAVMDHDHLSFIKSSSDFYNGVWDSVEGKSSRMTNYDPIPPFASNIPPPILTNPPGQPTNPQEHEGNWDKPIATNKSHDNIGDSCTEYIPKNYKEVKCSPLPDPFNPCADVMGYIFLRIIVWFVAMTAIVGNVLVLFVLLSYRHKMTVPKFLMCNLSFADLLMGKYLLMIASVDLHTFGEYFNYAIPWQHGTGCKIAGFISIFSSELSVFTLTVLTIERWYTIIYAIDLNKRIRLRQAARIIIAAWIFAILFAMLPLIGVGSYGVTSMCIPFYVKESDSSLTYTYVLFLLLFNAVAFLIICACYVKMYLTVHNPHTSMQRKDSKVAKRMAVLVFTDFACWAPLAIFGISAAFGNPLLSTTQSKFLIVLFYPLNSCANPFLYAIFTKAFRRDLFVMLAKHGMFEKQAMKYRHSGEPRSCSQANSYTSTRDGQKGHYCRSSASLLTQITSDGRSSVAMNEKDTIPEEERTKGNKLSHISIPLMMLHDNTNNSITPEQSVVEKASVATGENATNDNNKQPLMKKLSAGLHVDYTNSELDTVPEERCSNQDSDLLLEVPEITKQSFPKAPDAHDYTDNDDEDEDDDYYGKTVDQILNDSEAERKNSKTDSGIQSNTTTPTDKTDYQIANKTRVLELLRDCESKHETTL